MVARKKVSAAELVASTGTTSVKVSFVQRAGLWLALGVGLIIAFATAGVVIFLWIHYPSVPVDAGNGTEAVVKENIARYKELSGAVVQNAVTMFQTIVTQALLPVFTTILGYLFGKSSNEKEG